MSRRDARTDAVPDRLDAAVCIVGAGVAGITLARALAGRVDDILLIESGGLEFSEEIQELFAGRNLGLPYYDLTVCRLRYFGGTGNHWAGYCRSNDPVNYAARPELGIDGWPIGFDELGPYVAAAARLLGISDAFFDAAALLPGIGGVDALEATRLAPDFFVTVNQIAEDIRLAERFGDEIAASPRIHLVTDLNAVEIVLRDDHGAVAAIACRTLTGKSVSVRARHFVLACHTIETARLLLASNRQEPAGVANGDDLVGRHFMEHPYFNASLLIAPGGFPHDLVRGLAVPANRLAGLSLSEAAMRREGTLAYNCFFNYETDDTRLQAALNGITDGWTDPFSRQVLRDVRTVLADPGFLGASLADRLGIGDDLPFLVLEQMIEQAPDPASRVLLSTTERDQLGQRRADLDWRLNSLDLHTWRTGQDRIVRALGELGLGRVRVEEITEDLIAERVVGHYHHYGTTRMATSPRRGVVDGDLRVFGKPNLSICGGAVFPTSGAHGPTMHIIALAMRLADRLGSEMQAG